MVTVLNILVNLAHPATLHLVGGGGGRTGAEDWGHLLVIIHHGRTRKVSVQYTLTLPLFILLFYCILLQYLKNENLY